MSRAMLIEPTLDRLMALGLYGMHAGLQQQLANPQFAELAFEDRLALLLDQEWAARQTVRTTRLVKAAHFHQGATVEAIDFSKSRNLERSLVLQLANADWVGRAQVAVVAGPTGAGKSFLACALGQAACRHGFTVRYERLSRLLFALTLAQADGSYPKVLANLARVQLLILDDWLRDPLSPTQARDLLELLDDRYRRTATLIATQLPLTEWHARFPDPTIADAILDRLVHNAFRLDLKGESMRKNLT